MEHGHGTGPRRTIPDPPTFQHLKEACANFQRNQDPTYRVATLFIERFNGNPKDVADGICVLLLIWNKAFYNRFGSPNCGDLTTALKANFATIGKLRARSVLSGQSTEDDNDITMLFESLLVPLSAKGRRTPVGVAKTLHLLAPNFLPLWDDRIASAYRCAWSKTRPSPTMYLKFMHCIQEACKHVVAEYAQTNHVDEGEVPPFAVPTSV